MTQSTHPDIGKRVLVECTVEGLNEQYTGILSGVSDEWYEVVTEEEVVHKFMPKYWEYAVIKEKNMRKIGEIIEFEDMREGDVVEFVGYIPDYTGTEPVWWGYECGKNYLVGFDNNGGKFGPITDNGEAPYRNWGFVFKLVATQEQQNKPPKLQDGMVVEVGCGKRYIVFGDRLVGKFGWNPLSYYDDDLNGNEDVVGDNYVINKVFSVKEALDVESILDKDKRIWINSVELLWERKAIPTEQEQHINELEEQIEEMKQKVSTMKQKVNELRGTL